MAMVLQQIKDELFTGLIKINTNVYAWMGAQRLRERQPEFATEVGTTIDALTREGLDLIRRARTIRECVHACRAIANALRETGDEFESLEAAAADKRS
jgi:hypothetical protein